MKKKSLCIALAVLAALAFSVPASAVSVTDFQDVPVNSWYRDYVRTACESGLISGTSETTFSPDSTMSRGQFVTVLGRFAKVDTASVVNTGKFTDIPTDQYYTPYIHWAVSEGITNGLTDSTFGPNENMTKEQMATLLVRYADSKNMRLSVPEVILPPFGDQSSISKYAKVGVEYLYYVSVISGDENGNFHPQKAITRAEATTLFVKFATVHDGTDHVNPNDVVCTSIAVGPGVDLEPGATYQIPVTFTPANTTDKSITFESVNPAVATVDKNGLVTAVGVGIGRIEVVATNGVSADLIVDVTVPNSKPVGFEPAWGNTWQIGTYTDTDNIGYFCYDWTVNGETTTQTREVGHESMYMILSPQVVYSDGRKTIILPESYGAYKFTFTSSDPSLVSVNPDSTITVHRVITPSEGAKTVTITVHSGYFEASKTVTVTLYHQQT